MTTMVEKSFDARFPLNPVATESKILREQLTPEDPWERRSDGMKCKTCMWFVPKVPDPGRMETHGPGYDLGRCRRHAPTLNGYPAVFVNDWCGDHKLDENKL